MSSLAKGAIISGRYEVRGLLGKGGMGAVYEAHDRELDETVAIKVLKPEALAADSEQRFRAELKLARRVQHPNICKVFDFGRHGPLLYIVMERIEGTSLADLLKKGKPPSDPVALIEAIAEGLGAIHRAGIVHRDLKPANISVSSNGAVKVMDFGVAKEVGATTGLTATGMLVGTPFYMSPEQARGDDVDQRTDVYALGIIVCEVLGGFRPFVGDTPVQVIVGHLNKEPELGRLPKPAIPVVARALAKDPNARYDSALELVQDLRRGLAGEPLAPFVAPSSTAVQSPALAPTISGSSTTGIVARAPKRGRAAAGVAITALLVLMGLSLARNARQTGDLAQNITSTGSPSSPATAEGYLLIDGRPWARVIEVVGADGTSVGIPADASTPLRLAVLPQTYGITVVGPDGKLSKRISAVVTSATASRVSADFGKSPNEYADEFLSGMSWK